MPRIDFYSLEPEGRGDRFLMTCKLVEQLYAAGKGVLILCPDRDEARHLDRLLWIFKQESFIPHGMAGEIDEGLTPVLIGLKATTPKEGQVLVNLGRELPPNWELWGQIYEPIDNDPEVLEAGRARYRAYRQAGCEPTHQRLGL